MTITLEQLRTFIAAADAGSLIQVANQFKVSTPALTIRLKKLEKELDTTLFSLSSKTNGRGYRLVLTKTGLALLPYAKRALKEIEAGVAAIKLLEAGEKKSS